jgi:predicted transcriptional regulator
MIKKKLKPYTKAEIIASLQKLPDDATIDDAMERLYVMAKIEIGMAQAEAGDVFTQEEIEREMAEWQD